MQAIRFRKRCRVFKRSLKIVTMLDQFGSKRLHRAVFFATVAMRHDDRGLETDTVSGEGDALSMIPPRCSHNTFDGWSGAFEPVHINSGATQLERSDGRVVLMFDPDLCADP